MTTKHYFITSSGTGVGKTYVTEALTRQLMQRGLKVAALKPIISGYDKDDVNSDTTILCMAQNTLTVEDISPWRFTAALAPNMAAVREEKSISLHELVAFCTRPRDVDIVLVEGVGGIMTPLGTSYTVLNWMKELAWPVIPVVGTYLGAISHALTTIETLKQHGLRMQAVVVSESEESTVDFQETLVTLHEFIDNNVPLIALPRKADVSQDLTGLIT